ncbi:RNA 2',3'-cyclic phosphodiesterase [Deferribacteres bacterium DY0037]
MRAFIAVDIPEKYSYYDISEIKKYTRTTIVKPENRHITLFFLGDISPENVCTVTDCLKALPVERFKISMTGLDMFHQGAVYVTCESDALVSYRKRLSEILQSNGMRVDNKSFRMHMTLCRIRDIKDKSGLNNFIKSYQAAFQTTDFHVESIVLYKSSLTQQGPVYTRLYVEDYQYKVL